MPTPEQLERDPLLQEVADAIATGTSVDWKALEGAASSTAQHAVLRQLRELANLGSVYEGLPFDPDDYVTAGAEGVTRDGASERALPRWGQFVLSARLGEGAFGEVYLARDMRLDRDVALKLLRRRADTVESDIIDEGRALARLRHPNIVAVFGADRVNGTVGVWMEYVRGRTLVDVVRSDGPLSAADASRIGIDVCAALSAVHNANLLHRDIKAQNVMREDGGRIVVMDFGAALARRPGNENTAHTIAGTPLYLAPEVLKGGPPSVQSDLYSVGVLLFYLVTGSFPVTGAAVRDVRAAHQDGRRRTLREMGPDLPTAFVDTVDRLIDPVPEARFASAEELCAALENVIAEPAPATRVTWRHPLTIVGTTALLIALAANSWGWRRERQSPPLAFDERASVLVVPFENHTGDRAFDGAIDAAVKYDLGRSSTVSVVPEIRIRDTLRFMKRPLDVPIDAEVAREVALRDGGIRAMIVGRLDRFGDHFVVRAQIVEPATGRAAAQFQEEAAKPDDVVASVQRLSSSLRHTLGERRGSIGNPTEPLHPATTASFAALRAYSRAFDAGGSENWSEAAVLTREALRADPNFAVAHTWLGYALRNTSGLDQEAMKHFSEAVRLSDAVTEVERLWVVASHLQAIGERRRAAATFEALLRLDPNHYWALNNLTHLYAGKPEKQTALTQIWKQQARTRPNAPYWRTWSLYQPAFEAWLRRDPVTALALVQDAQAPADAPAGLRDLVTMTRADLFLMLGRLRDAEAVAANVQNAELGPLRIIATAAYLRGDNAGAARALRHVPDQTRHGSTIAFKIWLSARVGLQQDALALAQPGQPDAMRVASYPMYAEAALLALGDKRFLAPIARFLRERDGGQAAALRLSVTFADALNGSAKLQEACDILESQTASPRAAWIPTNSPGGIWWLVARDALARCYRDVGRLDDKRRVDEELTAVLALADEDFKIASRVLRSSSR